VEQQHGHQGYSQSRLRRRGLLPRRMASRASPALTLDRARQGCSQVVKMMGIAIILRVIVAIFLWTASALHTYHA
jgi:hypothetical protein